MMRSAVVVLWLCALLVVLGALPAARASGVQPVGEVVDHPVERLGGSHHDPRGDAHPGSDDLDLNSMPQETMQSLFNWAIKNSDPTKLREMANKVKAGERVDVHGLPDPTAASKAVPNQSRWTMEELEQKRKDVREVLDALSQQPTEAQYIKLATGMYTNTSLPKEDRLLALEELKELVRPVDNADDLHALGALAPLIHVAIDAPGEEDEDIAAAAASTLAVAMSNNAGVQALVHAWHPPGDIVDRFDRKTLHKPDGTYDACDDEAHPHWGVHEHARIGKRDPHHFASAPEGHYGDEVEEETRAVTGSSWNDVKARKIRDANSGEVEEAHGSIRPMDPPDPRRGIESRLARLALDGAVGIDRRVKSQFALSAMLRTSPLSRRAFFAADGAAFVMQMLGPNEPARVRTRALVMATDVFDAPTVHVTGNDERTMAVGERHLAIGGVEFFVQLLERGSPDAREKAVAALKAAIAVDERFPEKGMGGHVLRMAREHGAWHALRAAVKYFQTEAATDPDTREYMEEMAGRAGDLSALVQAPNDEL